MIFRAQTNGMMFSFGRDVNIQWKHGVNYLEESIQKEEMEKFKDKVDPGVSIGRISIILWGNCLEVIEEAGSPPMLTDNTRGNGHSIHRNRDQHYSNGHNRSDSRDRGGNNRGDSRGSGTIDDSRRRENSRSRSRDRRDSHSHYHAYGNYRENRDRERINSRDDRY
jgi:hypothetical protein